MSSDLSQAAYQRAYYLTHYWKAQTHSCRSYAVKHRLYDDLEEGDLEFLYVLQEGCCAYCGKPDNEVKLGVDHLLPQSQNGPNTLVNIVLSCFSCNRDKHNRTPEEYLAWLDSVDTEKARAVRSRFEEVQGKLVQELGVWGSSL